MLLVLVTALKRDPARLPEVVCGSAEEPQLAIGFRQSNRKLLAGHPHAPDCRTIQTTFTGCPMERLLAKGEAPITFDSDCREGIFGTCGSMIDGIADGPRHATATCQLHLRELADGAENG